MNIRSRIAAAALALLLASCDAATPPEQPPLAGAKIGGPFALTDENGRPATDRDLAGKWRVMYFGYTFCPDICPIDAQNIGAGLKKFEADDPDRGARVTPVFVTIDPARDTPAVLKTFTDAFHPRMVGLTGSDVHGARRGGQGLHCASPPRGPRTGADTRGIGSVCGGLSPRACPDGQPVSNVPVTVRSDRSRVGRCLGSASGAACPSRGSA